MRVGIAWPCEWCRSSCRGLWDSARRVMGGDPAQPSDSITVYSNVQRQSQSRSKSHLVGMLTALLFAGSTLLAVPPKSWAQEVIVRVAPPPVRVETAPPPPSRYHVWDPGHWRWDGRGYVWVPGHYIHNPHHYANWIPGHWVERHGGWYWVEGHWRH